jgi:nucleotide-binding universal stress UspA family protein
MFTVSKILVPVDFSPHSEAALDAAIEIAKKFEASVHLLHAYPIHVGGVTPYGVTLPDTLERDWRKSAQTQLDGLAERVAQAGLHASASLSPSPAAAAVVETAEEMGSDLIVMGTRGLSGLSHVLLGSVAERTLRLAPCPVLTVKAEGAE